MESGTSRPKWLLPLYSLDKVFFDEFRVLYFNYDEERIKLENLLAEYSKQTGIDMREELGLHQLQDSNKISVRDGLKARSSNLKWL